jgi:hypothetical protein
MGWRGNILGLNGKWTHPKQMLPLAYAFVPSSDLPSGAVLFRSSRVVSGTSQKKCCFREGAVSMLSGSLYSSTCRVAVICLPIHCCGLCFLHMMNCVVMCTAVEVLKSWHGMCWHCKVAVNVAGLSSDFGNRNLISSVMLCGQTKYKTLIRQLSEIILNLFDSCSRQSCHTHF